MQSKVVPGRWIGIHAFGLFGHVYKIIWNHWDLNLYREKALGTSIGSFTNITIPRVYGGRLTLPIQSKEKFVIRPRSYPWFDLD